MLTHDLAGNIAEGYLLDTIATKLGNTFVQLDGVWNICHISAWDTDETDDDGDPIPSRQYGEGEGWIELVDENGHMTSFNSTENINTEPEWPEAGFYWVSNSKYQLGYTKVQTYKAGLSPLQIEIRTVTGPVEACCAIRFLNSIRDGVTYPTIQEAVLKLLSSVNTETSIPISLTLLVGAHPYIETPVLLYNQSVVGVIKDDFSVKLNGNNAKMRELLDHLGVSYAD